MVGVRIAKGSKVWGGIAADWQCRVTGFTKHGIKVIWLTGPLAGKDACVCKETLRRKRGDTE